MPGCNKKRDVANLQTQLVTLVLKLAKHDVPVVAIWHQGSTYQIQGTKYLKDLVVSIGSSSVDTVIKSDVFNLSSAVPDEPLHDLTEGSLPENVRAKQVFLQTCDSDPERLLG